MEGIQISRARDLDLDLGSGHTAYRRASLINLYLYTLHWLNFPQRVTYKLCLLTYKCIHGLAPDYLTRLCVRVATVHGRPRLRSSDDHQLLIPLTRTVTLDRAPSTPPDQHPGTDYQKTFTRNLTSLTFENFLKLTIVILCLTFNNCILSFYL